MLFSVNENQLKDSGVVKDIKKKCSIFNFVPFSEEVHQMQPAKIIPSLKVIAAMVL